MYEFYIEHPLENRNAQLDRGLPEAVPCLTMELIEGESLAVLLAREHPLKPDVALPLLQQIVTGLAVLHDHHIIHRDLKPSNIMITREHGETRVVLMDFGLAKSTDQDGDQFISMADNQAGAPYFMAPEVLRHSAPSIASDVYALGLVIDEMVTQSRAFPGGIATIAVFCETLGAACSARSAVLRASQLLEFSYSALPVARSYSAFH